MSFADRMGWLRKAPLAQGAKDGTQGLQRVETPVKSGSLSAIGRGRGEATRGLRLPRFHSNAGDLSLTRGADRLTLARVNLRNAYTPSQPITDPWLFCGRTELLKRLIRAVEDQRLHAIVYGVRGIGKTSLLHVFADMAKEARYQVSYVTCGESASFSEMFRAVAANVSLLYHTDYGPRSAEGERGATLLDLTPSDDISPQRASELCAGITGTRHLIILDEFDRASLPAFNRDVAEFIKNLSDRAVRVQVIVAGVADNLQDLMNSDGVVQRSVIAIQVPRMASDEVSELIHRGEETSGVSFQAGTVEDLCDASAGMPYLASLLSQQSALVALSERRLEVTPADVVTAVSEVVEEIQGRLPKRARAFLEERARQAGAQLSAIARFAYLSGSSVSLDRVGAMVAAPGSADLVLSEINRLRSHGVLVDAGDDTEQSVRFRDDNELLYLWLLTVRDRMRDGSRSRAASSTL